MAIRRVRVVWTGTPVAGGALSTFYFADSLGTEQDCVDAVATFLGTVDGNMTTQISWATEADVVDINAVTGATEGVTATTPQTGAGASAGELLPAATQGLLRLRTNTIAGGREVRGRIFLPGMVESNNVSGRPESGMVTSINGAANTLRTDASVLWAVWSRQHGVAPAVASATMWTQWAVLRSRRD